MDANFLNGLSQAMNTPHMNAAGGSATAFWEDDAKMHELLQRLEQALEFYNSGLNNSNRPLDPSAVLAYRMALQNASSLVKDNSFRTMFLRAEEYDPQAAARRFMTFFACKMELFGAENLGKKIAISDLTDEDRKFLYEGRLQVAKEKDLAGRTIMWTMVKNHENALNAKNMLRAIYYMTMSVIQDGEVQKQGLVRLVYALQPSTSDSSFSFNTNAVVAAAKLRSALPARYSATHYCFTQESFISYINCEQQVHLQYFSRPPKVCLHYASTMEVQFNLQRCGIPVSCTPVNVLGTEIKVDSHEEWLESQKFKELLENGVGSGEDDIFSAGHNFVMGDLDPTPMQQSLGGPLPQSVIAVSQLSQNNAFPGQWQHLPSLNNFAGSSPIGNNSTTTPLQQGLGDSTARLLGGWIQQMQGSAQTQIPLPQLQLHRSHQQPSTSFVGQDEVSNFDVLFGRGKVKDHYGNIHLHQLINMKQDRYEAAERWEKTIIAEEIVSIIRDRGGRFLKPSKNKAGQSWIEVDAETAREKVSHTFRSRRPKYKIGSSS